MNIVIKAIGTVQYEALLYGEVLCRSRTPFLSAARKLLARGLAPETELTATQPGSPVVCLRSTLGEAAHWTVVENDPAEAGMAFPGPAVAPGSAFEGAEASSPV